MYVNGQGVPKDDQQAVFWYRKAADQGYRPAQYSLGVMYGTGRRIPKDDQQAYFWLLLASVADETAVEYRDIVEKRLTPQQRATAQADTRSWKPTEQ